MLDWVLPVCSAILSLFTGFLGLHVTLHPTEEPKKRFLYKLAFCLSSLFVCILIGIQGYSNHAYQTDLTSKVERIDKNTPPLAAYLTFDAMLPAGGIQLFGEGQRVSMNVYFKNDSALKLTDIHHYAELSVGAEGEENDLRKKYHSSIHPFLEQDSERLKTPFELDPGRKGAYFTVRSEPLTAVQIQGLRAGSLRLYLNTYLNWRDRGQIRNADTCQWIGFDNSDLGVVRGQYIVQVCKRITE